MERKPLKITVTLNPEQEKFFHELKYGLMDIAANNSDVINHALMELLIFERMSGDQVTNYCVTHYKEDYDKIINDPALDFGKKFKPQKA